VLPEASFTILVVLSVAAPTASAKVGFVIAPALALVFDVVHLESLFVYAAIAARFLAESARAFPNFMPANADILTVKELSA